MYKDLNKGQRYALKTLISGYNTFITGGAGVGKTYVVNKFIEYARNNKKNVMVCAPTGIAALNINGTTLHRQFHAPTKVLVRCNVKYKPTPELNDTDIIIIDEISMCRVDLFDFIMNQIANANSIRKSKGLKTIQIIVVGDFFQLPPVTKIHEKRLLDEHYKRDIGLGFAFESLFWNMLQFKVIELNEIVRQQDREFIGNLNNVRIGNKAYIDMIYNKASKKELGDAITVCGTNKEAYDKNIMELHRIDAVSTIYYANIVGTVDKEDTPAEEVLELREGARIMTLINQDGYKNGLLGTVLALYDNSILVEMDNGVTVEVKKAKWDIFRYETEEENGEIKLVEHNIGYTEQFPLKLAYAITIHKSQGQTFDRINLNPYSWDCGQLYVAISRVRRLEDLYFISMPDVKYIVVSLNVIKFYNSLKYENISVDVELEEEEERDSVTKREKASFGWELDDLLLKLNNI